MLMCILSNQFHFHTYANSQKIAYYCRHNFIGVNFRGRL